MAIVNAEKLVRYSTINPHELKLAEDLLFNSPPEVYQENLNKFIEYFRAQRVVGPSAADKLPVEDRLINAIVEGRRDGLIPDLDEALQSKSALEIVNGPLLSGMDVVGSLFKENKLILAEVLQSAEVMRAAIKHLEPILSQDGEKASRGRLLLATVKGDVHDIGKNLVYMIFAVS